MEPKEFDFEFPRGDTCPITFNLEDKNQNVLSNFDEIYFTVKKSYSKDEVVLQKKLTRGEITYSEGTYTLILLHGDTATLPYGKYVYDIQVKSGIYYKTVCIGNMTLSNESTWKSNE